MFRSSERESYFSDNVYYIRVSSLLRTSANMTLSDFNMNYVKHKTSPVIS